MRWVIFNNIFQAILNKLATSDGLESFSVLLKLLPKSLCEIQGRARKVELMRALAALEDFTACRFQDLANDTGKKPPTSSLKLMQELFVKCENRLLQHIDHITSDDCLSAIVDTSVALEKKKKRKKRAAETTTSTASKRKAATKASDKTGGKKVKASNGESSKGCPLEIEDETAAADDVPVDDDGNVLPRKPKFRPTNIVYDKDENVEVLSHARLTTKGGWRVQRASLENVYGTFTKIYLQKDRAYRDKGDKERFYKVAFSQVCKILHVQCVYLLISNIMYID